MILSAVLATSFLFVGSVVANAQVYNSKTTQTISLAPASGSAFYGTYLSSKSGSGLPGITNGGLTDKRVACSKPMTPDTCALHCSVAKS
jgi:hypothetical protein